MKAVLPALARPLIETSLPADLTVHWHQTPEDATNAIRDADIAWVDWHETDLSNRVALHGERLKWLFTIRAGLDGYDLTELARRGVVMTNGNGLNPIAVAEYAVMGMLVAAKRFDQVVRMADRREWPNASPGTAELTGSSALVIGMGRIGRAVAERLVGLSVSVTGVNRSGGDDMLTPDAWRDRLGDFDWVILAAPSTADTRAMLGATEFAAMKPTAWLINVARGDLVDQDALIDALRGRRIAGAFLDTVDPEPLPPEHPLWSAPNVIHSMHLSGRAQSTMFQRGAALFLRNLSAFMDGQQMENRVDLARGY
ncbi:D-2-hydroxyacid dehydrogenase [Sphingomonas sp. CJ99]